MIRLRGNRLNKILDRFMGVPLLLAIAPLTRLYRYIFSSPSNRSSRSVLILQIGTIGDAVLNLPAIELLRQNGFSIHALVSPANAAVFTLADIPFDSFDLSACLKNPLRLIRVLIVLHRRKFDYVIDFIPWLRLSALIAAFLRSSGAITLGFRTPG